MNIKNNDELDFEYPIEICEDPYNERTIYDVEKITFKNKRKNEKFKDYNMFDEENEEF